VSSSKATSPTVHGGYPSVGQPISGGSYGSIPIPTPAPSVTYAGNGVGNLTGSLNYSLSAVNSSDAKPVDIELTAPSQEVMHISDMANGSFTVSFYEYEQGGRTKATLDLDASLTPIESLRIQQLMSYITLAAAAGLSSKVGGSKPITYIRTHGLERHFRFSLA